MSGEDVAEARQRLNLPAGVKFDELMADAVRWWKWRIGLHRSVVNGGLGKRAQRLLFGEERRTPAEVVRARYRAQLKDSPVKPPHRPFSLRVVPRDAWGARPSKGSFTVTRWDGEVLWVHYTAMPMPSPTLAAEKQQMRDIQAFHQGPQRGWIDIGYAVIVGPSGTVYEGRGKHVVGAHCPGHNAEPSVCLMVGVGQSPTRQQLDAVKALQAAWGKPRLQPHANGFQTACPGPQIRKALGI